MPKARKRSSLFCVMIASSGKDYPWYVVADSIEQAIRIAREEKSEWAVIEGARLVYSNVVIDQVEE